MLRRRLTNIGLYLFPPSSFLLPPSSFLLPPSLFLIPYSLFLLYSSFFLIPSSRSRPTYTGYHWSGEGHVREIECGARKDCPAVGKVQAPGLWINGIRIITNLYQYTYLFIPCMCKYIYIQAPGY